MDKKGFTLIELLVVTVIIMILTNISYVSYDEVRKMNRDNKRKADLQLVAQSLESFKSDYGQYYHFSDYSFSDNNFLKRLQEKGKTVLLYNDPIKCIKSEKKEVYNKYINKSLKDPINKDDYIYYYFADTYVVSDCYKKSEISSNTYIKDTYLPGIKEVFSVSEGCDGYGECTKGESIIYNNLFSDSCYGEDSNKVLYILATKLEKVKGPAKNEIKKYFSFCSAPDKNIEKMVNYFEKLGLNYFIILEDIVDYWNWEEEENINYKRNLEVLKKEALIKKSKGEKYWWKELPLEILKIIGE